MGQETKRVAVYARCSLTDQHPENQLFELRRYCKERAWTIVSEFVDHGISGTISSRPQLDRLMEAVRKRKGIDAVLVYRFDRFARSVKHLLSALEEFQTLGVQFISYSECIDTGTALGKAMYTIIACMAALERDVIAERIRCSLRRAKAEGVALGRPKANIDRVRLVKLRAQGMSIRAISRQLGAPKSIIQRMLAADPKSLENSVS